MSIVPDSDLSGGAVSYGGGDSSSVTGSEAEGRHHGQHTVLTCRAHPQDGHSGDRFTQTRYSVHVHCTSVYTCVSPSHHTYMYIHLFHVTMEISVHSVENIPRYTADTGGACDNLVYYLVMHYARTCET